MTEQQPYELLQRRTGFELRRYPAHVVAEVTVTGAFDRAGTAAFRPLFDYINGRNTARRPVPASAVRGAAGSRAGRSEKVRMTAPVLQRGPLRTARSDGGRVSGDVQVVAFVLPAGMTEETAPVPLDPRVRLRTVPATTAAVASFSGRGSAGAFARHERELRSALTAAGLSPASPPRFARFDPPFTPWFLRRNEVVQDVADPGDDGRAGAERGR